MDQISDTGSGRTGPLNEDPRNKWIVMICLPLTVLVFYITAVAHFDYSPDDAYIYFQFAKNILHGNGFSFNANEPTYGFTSPLWLFIIVLFSKSGLDVVLTAKVLDLCIASGSLIVFYLLAYEVIREMMVALMATIAFSLNIWLLRWTATGMETSLSVLLVLSTLLLCLRNRYLFSVLCAALLTLVRPESFLLLGFIFYDIYINSNDKRHAFKLIALSGSLFAALLLPWLVYAYGTFGTIVSNTSRAKSAFTFDLKDVGDKLWNSISIIGASDGVALVVLMITIIVLVRMFKKEQRAESGEERFFVFRQSFIGIGWIILLPLAYACMHVITLSRYLLLITPLITIFAFAFLFRVLLKSKYSRFAYAGVVLFTGLSILQSQTVYRSVVKPGVDAFGAGMQSCLIPIGTWFKEQTKPDDVIMMVDIGAIGYYSDRKIFDAGGLASPEVIPYMKKGYTIEHMIDEKLYESLGHANYIVHRSEEPEHLKNNPDLIPLFSKPFYRMGLLKSEIYYYTVYKVTGDSLSGNQKE